MTPESTPPADRELGWTDPELAGGPAPDFAFPVMTPTSPSRARIAGPYARLAGGPDAEAETSGNGSSNACGASPARPSYYQRLQKAAKALKREVLAMYYALQNPRTPFLSKALAFFVVAYALSPIDLIPDFIPVLGLLDDLVLLPLLVTVALAMIPKDVRAECRARAISEPLRLSRNWPMAVFIAALWVAGLEWLVYALVRAYGTPAMQSYLPLGMVALGAVCAAAFGGWLALRLKKERLKRLKVEAAAVMVPSEGGAEPGAEDSWGSGSGSGAPAEPGSEGYAPPPPALDDSVAEAGAAAGAQQPLGQEAGGNAAGAEGEAGDVETGLLLSCGASAGPSPQGAGGASSPKKAPAAAAAEVLSAAAAAAGAVVPPAAAVAAEGDLRQPLLGHSGSGGFSVARGD